MQRLTFSDANVEALPDAERGQYVVKDLRTPKLVVVVGVRTKTWRIETERHVKGRRVRISKKLGEFSLDGGMNTAAARRAVAVALGEVAAGKLTPSEAQLARFAQSLAAYVQHLEQQAKTRDKPARWASEVARLGDKVLLPKWAARSLQSMSAAPGEVSDWHKEVTETHGPVTANHVIRIIRACYRYHAKRNRLLSLENHPCTAVTLNAEDSAETAMPKAAFAAWAKAVEAIENPVRRSFHRINLLTGCRPGELSRLTWADVRPRQRALIIRKSKTGKDISVPLSLPIVQELRRLRDAVTKPSPWVFPSVRRGDHMRRFDSDGLDYCGMNLRHTYRDAAHDVGVDELLTHFLLAHSPQGISQRYLSAALIAQGGAMRQAQAKISRRILALLG